MTVTFCGHKDYIEKDGDRNKILEYLRRVGNNQPIDFLLGGYGAFDRFALSVSRSYKKEYRESRLYFVTPYMTESYQKNQLKAAKNEYDSIIYPPIENVPPRFAISFRNKYMVEKADIVIAYVKRDYGGAAATLRVAKRLKKTYFNLAENSN